MPLKRSINHEFTLKNAKMAQKDFLFFLHRHVTYNDLIEIVHILSFEIEMVRKNERIFLFSPFFLIWFFDPCFRKRATRTNMINFTF